MSDKKLIVDQNNFIEKRNWNNGSLIKEDNPKPIVPNQTIIPKNTNTNKNK